MKVDVFAEFSGWAVLEKLQVSRPDIEVPKKESIESTKLLGKETANDAVLKTNLKLFYTSAEEAAGKVDEIVALLQSFGCQLVERRPYRESVIDVATNKVEREYCNDRVIFSVPIPSQ